MTKRILADKSFPPFDAWVVVFNGHVLRSETFHNTEREAKQFVMAKSLLLSNWDDATAAGFSVRWATVTVNVK